MKNTMYVSHLQVPPLAGRELEPRRGARQLLRDGGGVQPGTPGRYGEQDRGIRQGGTTAINKEGRTKRNSNKRVRLHFPIWRQ